MSLEHGLIDVSCCRHTAIHVQYSISQWCRVAVLAVRWIFPKQTKKSQNHVQSLMIAFLDFFFPWGHLHQLSVVTCGWIDLPTWCEMEKLEKLLESKICGEIGLSFKEAWSGFIQAQLFVGCRQNDMKQNRKESEMVPLDYCYALRCA